MKPYFYIISIILLAFSILTVACKKDPVRQPDQTYNPEILSANFSNSTNITNTYFPMASGKKYIFESQTADGLERVVVQRLAQTKTILGITCIVVNDKVTLDGKLFEDTDDWYAQDNDGNVWYMGEYVNNYNPDGSLKDHAGSWEAGVDGAKPGIAMLADPQTGMVYRQEYYFNEAEDQAEVLQTGLKIIIPFGAFDNCIKTRDWTELDPDANENKIYAPGIGLIKAINLTDNEEEVLVEVQE